MLIFFAAMLFMTACEEDEGGNQPNVEITNMSATSAYHLAEVTVQGTNLNAVQFIFVGTRQATFELNDGNSLTFVVPESATPGENTVTLAMPGTYRVKTELEVMIRPIPLISDFDPYVGIGNDLTIKGTGMDHNISVTFDGTPATVVSSNGTELVVTVPAGISDSDPVEIEVTNDFGSTTNTGVFIARQGQVLDAQMSQGEGDEFTAWEKLNGVDGMTEVTGEAAYAGGRSMRIAGPAGNPWDKQLASTPTQLTFGETYTAIVWARAEAAGAIMRVSVSQWDGSGADYFYGADVELSTVWEPYTWTFEVTNDLPEHKLVLDMGHTDVPFLVDNVSILPGELGVSTGPVQLLANSSFEDGLNGWEILNGGEDVEITSDDAHTGSNSLKVTPAGGNPWDRQFAADGVPLTFEGNYEIKLWAKAAGPDGVMRVTVSQWDGNGADYFYGDDITVTEEWAEYSWTFQVTNDLETHRVVLDMGAGTQILFIDDVTLTEVE